jgi:nitrate reductase cytochrome c-type subunit
MNRFVSIAVVAASILLFGALTPDGETANQIPDHQLGLSKGKLTEVAHPPIEKKNLSDPGEASLIPADYSDQPTLVPHGIADYLPITMEENQCADCHAVAEKEEGEPTPIPISHYTDLRNSPGMSSDEIVGARYVCVTCHVVPGEHEALIGNGYRADE